MAHSRTNLSSLSELSTQIPVEAIVFPNDQESPDEIFEYICADIRGLCDEIKKHCRVVQRTAAPATNAEKTVVMQEMSTLLENKTSIVNKLTAFVKESKYDDFSHFRGEATMSIPFMMEEETNSCQKAVELLEKINQDNLKELELLTECEKISCEIREAEVEPEMTENLLHKINTEVTREFKQCKKEMKMIIDTLYPDSNCMEILGGLVAKSIENDSSEWYEINASELPVILMLNSLGLIKNNPDNDQQVKLII